jgi:hypothetical protein
MARLRRVAMMRSVEDRGGEPLTQPALGVRVLA